MNTARARERIMSGPFTGPKSHVENDINPENPIPNQGNMEEEREDMDL